MDEVHQILLKHVMSNGEQIAILREDVATLKAKSRIWAAVVGGASGIATALLAAFLAK